MTKLHILSGFLGAGKTTLLRYLFQAQCETIKRVLLENECGPGGLDLDLLEMQGLSSGHLLCAKTNDFSRSIQKILQREKPDEIILEPSGICLLSEIVQSIQETFLKDKGMNELELAAIVAVVDAQKYERYAVDFGAYYEDSLKVAKDILVTRTEMLTESQKKTCFEYLRHLNPGARIHFRGLHSRKPEEWVKILFEGQKIEDEDLGSDFQIAYSESARCAGCVPSEAEAANWLTQALRLEREALSLPGKEGGIGEVLQVPAFSSKTWMMGSCSLAAAEALRVALRAGAFGKILRLKAVLPRAEKPEEWLHLEYAGGEWQRGRVQPRPQAHLMAIGTDWEPMGLEAFFRAHGLSYRLLPEEESYT